MVCQIYWLSSDLGSCAYLEKQLADFLCDDQDIFFRSIRQQGLVFSTLCFDGEELEVCVLWRVPRTVFFHWVLDLIVSSEWLLQSSKPCLAMMFAGIPFRYHLFSAFFKLR
jgi:hypothetical protein